MTEKSLTASEARAIAEAIKGGAPAARIADWRAIASTYVGLRRRGAAMAAISAIAGKIDRRRQAKKPPLAVSEWCDQRRRRRAEAMLLAAAPTKCGAGELSARVEISTSAAPTVDCRRLRGDSDSVARSYRYAVYDHVIRLDLPRHMVALEINGVMTIGRLADLRAGHETNPVPCWWVTTGRGISVRLVSGYLYRGVHILSPRSRKSVDRKLEPRETRVPRDAAKTWISETALRRIGACEPGIAAARSKAAALLSALDDAGRRAYARYSADGTLRGVRADWAMAQSDNWRSYVERVL